MWLHILPTMNWASYICISLAIMLPSYLIFWLLKRKNIHLMNRYWQPLRHQEKQEWNGSRGRQMLWGNLRGYLRCVWSFKGIVIKLQIILSYQLIEFVSILVGCQEPKHWEHSNFVRWSSLPDGLYGFCAGTVNSLKQKSFVLYLKCANIFAITEPCR